ncbi:MAG: sugar phosphate isomerase, partial [Planctomycetota bacterium]|nr:sugar phosphate isomerase [Planctomycetota bacterium]
MWLFGQDDRRVALCYSMNVHPGEGLDDVLAALRDTVIPLKERLGVCGAFTVGLRLARRAAEETESRADELKTLLDAHDLQPVTVNAFPFGDFHAERVKEDVYRPDWADAQRAIYTLRSAVALAAVAPRKTRVSLSTVPLSFKAWRPSINAMTGRIIDLINPLQAVERKSGVRVRLGLEPEPFCFLETAEEMIHYWKDHLLPACRARFG